MYSILEIQRTIKTLQMRLQEEIAKRDNGDWYNGEDVYRQAIAAWQYKLECAIREHTPKVSRKSIRPHDIGNFYHD